MPELTGVLAAVHDLLGSDPSPDTDGFQVFPIGPNGVERDLKDFLKAALSLEADLLTDLLPDNLAPIVPTLTSCRASATGLVVELHWSQSQGFDAAAIHPFFPAATSAEGLKAVMAFDAGGIFDDGGRILFVDVEINDNLSLSANVDLSNRIVGLNVQWAEGSPTLGVLLDKLGLPSVGFKDLSLEKVALRALLQDQFYSLDLVVNDVFQLDGHGFSISRAELNISYASGLDGGFLGSAVATALLGRAPQAGQADDRIQFDLSATFDGPDLGWTFSGTAQNISIAGVLGKFGVSADSPFNDLHVDSVELSFNTVSKDVGLSFQGSFTPISATAAMVAEIKLARQPDGSYAKSFSGKLTVGPVEFDLVFDSSGGSTAILGTFHDATAAGAGIDVREMVAAVVPDDVAAALPADPVFRVKDALFAFVRGTAGGIGVAAQPGKFLFAIDTDFSLDLSSLANVPLIGQAVAGEKLEADFEVLVYSEQFNPEAIRSLLPQGAPHIPDELGGKFQLLTTITFGDFTARLDLGVEPSHLTTSASAGGEAAAAPSAPAAPAVPATVAQPASDNIQWKDVEKHFGPLSVHRIGLSFDSAHKKIGVFLEADLSVSGLTLSVEGLGGVYDLGNKSLTFALRGLGIDFSRGGIEIGGGFLNQDGDFAGKVVIRAKSFTLAALGAVAVVDGQPSIFIYGLLNYPLGGPSFFFVEGLAAGFGYNRTFHPPTIDKVRECPLVIDALAETAVVPRASDPSDKAAVAKQLQKLHEFVSPSVGEYFFAAGIKFSSFKLLHSFLLVGVVAGKRLEIDLLGVSTYQNPPVPTGGLPPLAHIELNLVGRIAPDEGYAIVQAQLTDNSFVYSNLVQLAGGFAFATWFGEPPGGSPAIGPHAGDFVLSVGGYHPQFNKPAWYPDVPRLTITYQVTENIYVKGTAYFALTPSMLMAGAALEASATVGPISATFRASIDFLIGWEPYHYDATVSVSIKVHFGKDFELGADLHLFGPDFSGVAHVHGFGFSFTVKWGDAPAGGPTPIEWSGDEGFRGKFLLTDADRNSKKISTVRLVDGVIGSVPQSGAADLTIANPGTFRLETSCPIPFDSGKVNDTALDPLPGDGFGVAPMNVRSATAIHTVTFLAKSSGLAVDAAHIAVKPVSKKFPPALWGKQFQVTKPDAPPALVDAYGGIGISPGTSLDDGTEVDTLRRNLDFSSPSENPVAAFATPVTYAVTAGASLTAAAPLRSALLAALGFDAATAVSISNTLEGSLVAAPSAITVT